MPAFLYIVRAVCRDLAQREQYRAWLVPHHVELLRQHGASAVHVSLHEAADEGSSGPAIEAHYTFPSREAFEAYVREHAPALRADSVKHFPPGCGIEFERRMGTLIYAS